MPMGGLSRNRQNPKRHRVRRKAGEWAGRPEVCHFLAALLLLAQYAFRRSDIRLRAAGDIVRFWRALFATTFLAAFRWAAHHFFIPSLRRFRAAADIGRRSLGARRAAFFPPPAGRPLRGAVPCKIAIARSNRSRSAINNFKTSAITHKPTNGGLRSATGIWNEAIAKTSTPTKT